MAAIHESIATTRALLASAAEDLWAASWDADSRADSAQMARVATLAEHADGALFDVLNAAYVYLKDEESAEAMGLSAEVVRP